MPTPNFYRDLPAATGSLQQILATSQFVPVPSDWDIIVTDIQGSTKATLAGRGKDINTLAASCVIACLNIAKRHQIDIPFLYGGDGATLLVPHEYCDEMIAALKALRGNAHKTYGLRLRVGSISAREIYAGNEQLTLAKWAVAPGYMQAIFLGNGLTLADKLIKADPTTSDIPEVEMPHMVNLNGLLCRWNNIVPTVPKEVVCLIIEATDATKQAETYIKTLDAIDAIYGEYSKRHPVQVENLNPSLKARNFSRKDKLANGTVRPLEILKEGWKMLLHAVAFKFHVGPYDTKTYMTEMKAATDTLHLSGGTLFTIVSGTSEQRQQLRQALDELEMSDQIKYGLSVCDSSVVTCYVERFHAGHHHFLDGANGGYTLAAKEWKAKRTA